MLITKICIIILTSLNGTPYYQNANLINSFYIDNSRLAPFTRIKLIDNEWDLEVTDSPQQILEKINNCNK